jgi:4-amino-4-deoxy-L-arabinose transferase-like glycosyltransferase
MLSQLNDRASRLCTFVWLACILGAGLLLRSAGLLLAMLRSSDPWIDPDGYAGRALESVGNGWHWDFWPFTFGPLIRAPLYPFVLSFFAPFPHYPLSAALAQVAIATASIAGVYVLGRDVHSSRAGLIAAGFYALWLPALQQGALFQQEQLHVPLVIAGLALLVRASARSGSPSQFAVAGFVLGLAALARSMPLYFIGPAALLYVAFAPDRRAALRQCTGLLGGFLLVVLPWCALASIRQGQLILIDNMGSAALGMAYREVRPDVHTAPPPTVIETLRMLWLAATREPIRFWGDRVSDFRDLFRLVGGQWLEQGQPATSRLHAIVLTVTAHGADVMFALSAVLAPLGVVLGRRRREVSLVALWVGLHLGLLVIFAWHGVRYRAPYEPELIVLAAVTLASGWARPPRPALWLALTATIAIGAALATSIPATARARATYGVAEWVRVGERQQAPFTGEAGFQAITTSDLLDLTLVPVPRDSTIPVQLRVSLDGREVDRIVLRGGVRELTYPWNRPGAYVELRATFEGSRRPAPLVVIAPAPRP